MRLNTNICRRNKTQKHNLRTGALAITLPNGSLVAYKRDAGGAWDWIRKGFQFFGKPKKRGVDKP